MSSRIGFIGAGNIAWALISGIVKSGMYAQRNITIYDTDPAKIDFYKKNGYNVVESEQDVVLGSDFVFLALRQADLPGVLKKIKLILNVNNVLITVAAGISTDYIKKMTRSDCKVVRVMPNTPAQLGCGATALSYALPLTYSELSTVRDIFETVGIVEMLPEDKMNEVISLNSTAPVYVYMLLRAMIDGAKNQGIDGDTARRLAVETVLGAAKMAEASDRELSEMINEVCTPNGTTVKAVEYLEKRGFEQAVADAMTTCTKRAAMLEKEIDN